MFPEESRASSPPGEDRPHGAHLGKEECTHEGLRVPDQERIGVEAVRDLARRLGHRLIVQGVDVRIVEIEGPLVDLGPGGQLGDGDPVHRLDGDELPEGPLDGPDRFGHTDVPPALHAGPSSREMIDDLPPPFIIHRAAKTGH